MSNITQDDGLIEAKIRDTNAAADLKEFKLAILRRDYIAADEVDRTIAEGIARAKSKILAIPAKLTPQLSGRIVEAQEVSKILTQACNEALNELAEKA